jgi:2-polyprenyl-3-methyl-5-hydroxy-6-metoxy-1,4-benzoquinol methylase
MSSLRLLIPPKGVLVPNDELDPLDYYYHRWIGWLYRHRLQMGLKLLPAGGKRVLEVGVGSGVLVPTLTRHYPEYTGTDLTLAPGLQGLVAPKCKAEFLRADLLKDDLPAGHYDAIVCFSVLEHIADSRAAAQRLASALAPGGTLVCGYPMVSKLMSRAFSMIGYKHIDDDHVSAPAQITAALADVLTPIGRHAFPPAAPQRAALYQCTAWTKPARP